MDAVSSDLCTCSGSTGEMTFKPRGVRDPRRGWCVWMNAGGWVTETTVGTAGADEGPSKFDLEF